MADPKPLSRMSKNALRTLAESEGVTWWDEDWTRAELEEAITAARASRPKPRHRFDCDCPCHARLSGICRDCLAASRPEPGADLAGLLHEEWDRRVGEPSEPGVPCPECRDSAARLAARGVTVSPDLAGLRKAAYLNLVTDWTAVMDFLGLAGDSTAPDVIAHLREHAAKRAALPASPEDGLRDAARNAAAYLDSIGRYKAAHHADALRAALKEQTDD